MIAIDSNILVYAHRRDSPWHEPAKAAVTDLAEGKRLWALPWPCVHEFFGVVTHPRIFSPPSTTDEALTQVESWLDSPSVVLLAESRGYWSYLEAEVRRSKVAGPQVHDARVVALCKFHRVHELWSADRDFGRFADLSIRNPLVS